MIMKDKHVRYIVEDLLPLYEEGLVSDKTKEWIETQLQQDEELKKLAENFHNPLEKEELPKISEKEQEKIFKNIQRKLSLYQIIFVAFSFLLANQTALLNDSFGFILWYTVLGLVIYLFYTDMKIVFYVSFIPIFLWSIVDGLSNLSNNTGDISIFSYVFSLLISSVVISLLHYFFAFVGSIVGLLIKKLKNEGGNVK